MAQIAQELGIVLILLFASGGLVYLVHLVRRRYTQNNRTLAAICELKPLFRDGNPSRTSRVHCRYDFMTRGESYTGECLLPLSFFTPSTPSYADPYIIFDIRVDLPVLYYDTTRVVGEEAIEHFLTQRSDTLQVEYLVRNPSKNFSVEKKEPAQEQVK